MRATLRFILITWLGLGPRPVFATCGLNLLPNLIARPIPGLFESLPRDWELKIGEYRLITHVKDSGEISGEISLFTVVDREGRVLATAERHFSVDRKNMTLWSLKVKDVQPDRSAPSFLNPTGSVPLVAGRGTPTSALLTLHQMRLVGVSYAELRLVTTGPIHNTQTLLELRHRPKIADWMRAHRGRIPPAALLEEEILSTNTGRYLTTTLTQAGLRIKDVQVHGGGLITVGQLLRDSWALNNPVRARQGLIESEFVPTGFYLIVKVGPI